MQNSNQHRPNDFTPVTGAMDLADYVITITDNINTFPDFIRTERKNPDGTVSEVFIQRQDSLTQIVRDQTFRIFLLTFSANEINLTREPWRKMERLEKQAEVIRLCGEHIAAIQLCRKHFHLSKKRNKHWTNKAKELRAAIAGWHDSDKGRYKEI